MLPKVGHFYLLLFLFLFLVSEFGLSQKIWVKSVVVFCFVFRDTLTWTLLPGMGPFTNLAPPKGQTNDRL